METVRSPVVTRGCNENLAVSVGLNVGHGYTKLVVLHGEQCSWIMFPSLLTDAPASTRDQLIRVPYVKLQGRSFWVGEDAQRATTRPSYTQTRLYDPIYIPVLVGAALRRVGVEFDTLQGGFVVTGLPATWARIGAHAQAIAQRVREGAAPIKLGKIRVIPEPVGCVYAAMLTEQGEIADDRFRSGRVAVVDIGHGTVDVAVINRLISEPTSLATFQLGTVQPLTQLQQWLNGLYEVDVPLDTLDAMVRNEQTSGDDAITLPSDWTQYFYETGQRIAARLEQVWGTGRQFDAILIGGGGAAVPVMTEPLLKVFSRAQVIADPQLAIAQGYARFGRYLQHH